MEPTSFLLAMKAAGAAIQLADYPNRKKIGRLGAEIDNAATEANLALVEAQSAAESEQAAASLRDTMGYQLAISAAQGSAGAGSALARTQPSEADYTRGKQTRRMNLLARESGLRSQQVLSGLHTLQSETKLGQKMTSQMVSLIDSNQVAGFLNNKNRTR